MEQEGLNQNSARKPTVWQKISRRSKDYLGWFWVVVLGIYIAAGATRSMINNYHLREEIKNLESDIFRLELEKAQLQALSSYYETDDYKEKELRKRLLLKKPGEYVIAMTESKSEADKKKAESSTAPQLERSNFEKWVDFFKNGYRN